MKRTGPRNVELTSLIGELRKQGSEQKANLWKRLAEDLERPTRQRREVNLSNINRSAGKDEIIVVPGKVLGSGSLDHKVTIAAFQFSEGAKQKLQASGSTIVPLLDLCREKPNGKKIRILG